jgi:hypothetical protein
MCRLLLRVALRADYTEIDFTCAVRGLVDYNPIGAPNQRFYPSAVRAGQKSAHTGGFSQYA